MDCFKQTNRSGIGLVFAGLAAVWVALAGHAAAANQQGEVQPPTALAWLSTDRAGEGDAAERRTMTWKQVTERIAPADLPKPDRAPPAALQGAEVVELLKQADSAIARGEVFGAIRLLREAELKEPDNLTVARRLGAAYMLSGNRVRGAAYLQRVLSYDHGDAGALVLLADHASERDQIPLVLGLCEALLEADKRAGVLADLYRARSLWNAGYDKAGAKCLKRVIDAAGKIDAAALKRDTDIDPDVLRELRVLITLEPELRIRLGDLLLSGGDEQAASKVYAAVDTSRLADAGALIARRAYLALRSGDQKQASELVVGLLALPTSAPGDAGLVTYLVKQGVSAEALAEQVEAAIQTKGATLSLLTGLAEVAQPVRAIEALEGWLSGRPADPALLRQAARLVTFDDDRPEDAQALAMLLNLTAKQMASQPEQARRFAQATVGELDAYICLLRALRRPELSTDADDAYRALVVAVGYEHAERLNDAIAAYQRALELDPDLAARYRLPLAQLMLDADRPKDALVALKDGGAEGGWEHFALTAKSISALGDHTEALKLVDAWQNEKGRTTPGRMLRAELLAASGEARRACEELIGVVRENPIDERPYKLALDLIDRHLDDFRSVNTALNMRNSFVMLLEKNLPDSPTSRIEQAFDIYDDPEKTKDAEHLLLGALEGEPDNTLAWSMLVVVYELSDEEEKAEEARARLRRAGPPGLDRVLTEASRAIGEGEMQAAADMIQRALELDREGILPGRDMTGDVAASLMQLLSSADPDLDTEAMSLSMVKRFPDNVLLNNALGYQWAVQGKNLNQARAMIQRALDRGGDNHSVLDSLAWVQYKLGDFARAEATQRRSIEMLREEQLRSQDQLRASKAVLYDHMGDIMFKQGETASAIRHWQIARAQRLEPEDLMFEPELRTLAKRVDEKITAVREGKEPPVEPVPGPEAHGPEGHPADQKPEIAPQDPVEG